jgi:hypothetical protein
MARPGKETPIAIECATRNSVQSGEALGSDEWCTPKDLAMDLGHFMIDPCSNERSHIRAETVCMLPIDGLADDWRHWSVYVNPPYSNVMPWARKLAAHQGPWCALVKLDPSTAWWRELVLSGASWSPFRKRVAFERPDKPPLTANFPSALVWHWWTPPAAMLERLWVMR